jgi:hypothetical protein
MTTSAAQNGVEIWFPIAKDGDDGCPQSQEWEQLWSWPTEAGYRIGNIPFFAKGVARGDVVSAIKTDQGWLCFDRMVSRSGNSTFRIWLALEAPGNPEDVLREIRNLGREAEITLARLIAADVGPLIE